MSSFDRTATFLELINSHRRISVATLAQQINCSRQNVYKMITKASGRLPIRLEQGVVINDRVRPT